MEFVQNINQEFITSVALPIALAVIMFSLGLGLKISDFTRVVRRPLVFFVGAINQAITLPLIAFALVILFNLPPSLAVGMMIISLCPGGVTSNIMTKISGGDVALSISLTAIISLLSIITMPIAISIVMGLFVGTEIVVDASELSLKMAAIVAVPVLIGMLVRAILRRFAVPVESFFTKIAIILFIVIMLLALYKFRNELMTNLPILGPALVSMLVISLFVGWASSLFLRMPRREVTTIALETGVQNGTVGIAVAAILAGTNEGLSDFAMPSAVYGVLMYVIAIPFVLWRRAGDKKQLRNSHV